MAADMMNRVSIPLPPGACDIFRRGWGIITCQEGVCCDGGDGELSWRFVLLGLSNDDACWEGCQYMGWLLDFFGNSRI